MGAMGEHFDIAVIGSGPGGYIAALKAAQMGAAVAVVEKEHLGGTCLNHGCIPSKALLASSELIHRVQHAEDMGIKVEGKVGFDWPGIQKRKDKVIRTLRGGVGALFKARKIKLFKGSGVLNAPGKVAVTAGDGAAEELTADKIILGLGSGPARIPGWPRDPNLVCTSDESLHWKDLPKRLLIVGGGAIGCEFACMLQPFGVEVIIVEMMARLLPEMDPAIAQKLEEIFTQRGIICHTDTKVTDLAEAAGGLEAVLSAGETLKVDRVLVATGRRPNTEGVGLETVGLTTDRGFIRVNDRMETPVKGYYCIGDANGRCLLAHAASAQGAIAAQNALGRDRVHDAPVPTVVYTFPEIAGVGMTRKAARENGLPVAVGTFPLSFLGKALAAGDADGFVRVLRHRETGELLGVHMMGHNVSESISAAVALLGRKASVEDLAETIFPHPTISEALKDAAEDALSAALHLPPRKAIRAVVAE